MQLFSYLQLQDRLGAGIGAAHFALRSGPWPDQSNARRFFRREELGNPVRFLALAVKPNLRQHPTSPFRAAMTVSFALTTVGYAGAAWSVGRAASLAL